MLKEATVELLEERLRGNGAEVLHATAATLSQTIIGLIGQRGWHRLVSVRRNRVGHPSVLGDDPPIDDLELALLDAVVTESAGAIADSGTVWLDHGPGQGRKVFTEIPAVHVCVVEASRIVDVSADAPTDAVGVTQITGPDGPSGRVVRRPLVVVIVDDA